MDGPHFKLLFCNIPATKECYCIILFLEILSKNILEFIKQTLCKRNENLEMKAI